MIGRRARLIALVHRLVRTLDVAGEQLRVEQRGRQAIARELVPDGRQSFRVPCQLDCKTLVVFARARHKLGKADCIQQAHRHPLDLILRDHVWISNNVVDVTRTTFPDSPDS